MKAVSIYKLGVCGDLPGKYHKRHTVSDPAVVGLTGKVAEIDSLFNSLECVALMKLQKNSANPPKKETNLRSFQKSIKLFLDIFMETV